MDFLICLEEDFLIYSENKDRSFRVNVSEQAGQSPEGVFVGATRLS